MSDTQVQPKQPGQPWRPVTPAVFAICFLLLAPLLWTGKGSAEAVAASALMVQAGAGPAASGTVLAMEATAALATSTASPTAAPTATPDAAATEAASTQAAGSATAAAGATEAAASASTALASASAAASLRSAQEATAAAARAVQATATVAAATVQAEAQTAVVEQAVAQTAAAEAQAAAAAADAALSAQATVAGGEATIAPEALTAVAEAAAMAQATSAPVEPTAAAEATPAVTEAPTAVPTEAPTALPPEAPTATPVPVAASPSQYGRLALGNYFVWFDGDGWDDCNISAGDKPLEPYSSDDPAAIRHQVDQAISVGLDGFVTQWYAPGERTDSNFAQLLAQSQGTGFQSTIMFLRHIWAGSPAPTVDNMIEALRYIMNTYSGNGNFLHAGGKPVIFFTDVYRVPGSPVATWQAIRDQVDPNRQALWIAEGLDASYLSVFDGLYVYKITHAAYPNDYLKDSRWAANVRQWAQNTGQPKLWIATISPGLDDTRAGCRPDVRVPSAPHKMDRGDGAFYQATFDAAIQSAPDWLFVQSWNEWVEGTYVEPSAQYGDRYLQLTRELVARFKGG